MSANAYGYVFVQLIPLSRLMIYDNGVNHNHCATVQCKSHSLRLGLLNSMNSAITG